MKLIFFIFFVLIGSQSYGQPSLDLFINELRSVIISGGDISIFSDREIPENIEVNFIVVEDLILISQNSSIIRFKKIGPNNRVTGCVEFEYLMKDNSYFLRFGEIEEAIVFGKPYPFVNPWKTHDENCDD